MTLYYPTLFEKMRGQINVHKCSKMHEKEDNLQTEVNFLDVKSDAKFH